MLRAFGELATAWLRVVHIEYGRNLGLEASWNLLPPVHNA